MSCFVGLRVGCCLLFGGLGFTKCVATHQVASRADPGGEAEGARLSVAVGRDTRGGSEVDQGLGVSLAAKAGRSEIVITTLLSLFAAVVLLSPVALADDVPPSIDRPLRSGARAPGDAAVVIGVEDYYQFPDVPFATADARAFRDLVVYTLGVPPDRVWHLSGQVTRRQMEEAVAEAGAATGSSGRLWIYFAGHGLASPSTSERILLAGDAPPDPEVIDDYAVSVRALRDAGARNGARVAVVTDACFTGGSRDGAQLVAGRRFAVPVYDLAETGRVVEWVAASAGQTAGPLPVSGHGAFTYFVVGALRGWADGELGGDRDGAVTLGEAQFYVERMLQVVGLRQQTPVMSTTSSSSVVSRGTLEEGPSDNAVAGWARSGGVVATPGPAAPATDPFPLSSRDSSTTTATRSRGPRRGGIGGEVMAGLPLLSAKLGYRTGAGTLFGIRCTVANAYYAGALGSSGWELAAMAAQPELFIDAPIEADWNAHVGLGGGIYAELSPGIGLSLGAQYAPASSLRVNVGLAAVLADSSGIGPDINVGWAF